MAGVESSSLSRSTNSIIMIIPLPLTLNRTCRHEIRLILNKLFGVATQVIFLFLLLLSNQLLALDKSTEKQQIEKSLSKYFTHKIADLDKQLFVKGNQLAKDTEKLAEFVNQNILNLWSSTKTLKLMLGSKNWKMLSNEQIAQLEIAFDDTVHRYVKEGMSFYDGQRAKFLSLEVNDKLNRGYLTVELQPIYLPAFNIVFKITKIDNDWQLYDIFVEGISYIKMKKNEYRRILHEKDFQALIRFLDEKNGKQNTSSSNTQLETETEIDKFSDIAH